MWRLSEAPGPAPWLDEEFLAEQRDRLLPSSYARLFDNEWVAAEDRLVREDDLAACTLLSGPVAPEIGMTYVIGLDIGVKHDATAAAVCHATPVRDDDGNITGRRVWLDRLETWQGTPRAPVDLRDVTAWVEHTATAYNRATVVVDPYQAALSVQQLRARDIHVEEYPFTSPSASRLALTLHSLLRSRSLVLPDDEALLDELRNVRLRETLPGVLRIDHDADAHDDKAISLSLAAHRLTEQPVALPGAFTGVLRPADMPLGSLEREWGYSSQPFYAEAERLRHGGGT